MVRNCYLLDINVFSLRKTKSIPDEMPYPLDFFFSIIDLVVKLSEKREKITKQKHHIAARVLKKHRDIFCDKKYLSLCKKLAESTDRSTKPR